MQTVLNVVLILAVTVLFRRQRSMGRTISNLLESANILWELERARVEAEEARLDQVLKDVPASTQ